MWTYKNKEFTSDDIPDNVIGFVYLITNITNDKKYIGKKKFLRSYKKKSKTKRTKRMIVESDWMDYFGSSVDLQKDVESLGKESFRREILHLCESLGDMSYLELKEQVDNNVLFRDDFYNSYVGARIHRKHLKLKNKISLT
jgi:hypothetical protein